MMRAVSAASRDVAPAILPRDPRALLLAVTALVAASLATVGESVAMLGLLGFVCAWHVVVTGGLAATGASLRRVVPFAVFIVLLNAVFGPGKPVVALGPVRIVADAGLAHGVYFALRLALMLMSASLLLAAVPPEALAGGLHDVVRPVSRRAAGAVALFVFLAMGFVPLLADEFQRVRTAQSFRGGGYAPDFLHGRSAGLRRRAEAVRAALIPLLVSAIHRSGQLAMAVELRDVRRRLPGVIGPARFRAADAALLASTAAAIVVASGWLR